MCTNCRKQTEIPKGQVRFIFFSTWSPAKVGPACCAQVRAPPTLCTPAAPLQPKRVKAWNHWKFNIIQKQSWRERERERKKPMAFQPSKIWIGKMQWDGLKTWVPGMDTRELWSQWSTWRCISWPNSTGRIAILLLSKYSLSNICSFRISTGSDCKTPNNAPTSVYPSVSQVLWGIRNCLAKSVMRIQTQNENAKLNHE